MLKRFIVIIVVVASWFMPKTTFGQEWTEIMKVTAFDTVRGNAFGNCVELSKDFLVVGAQKDEVGNSEDTAKIFRSGAVYVYKRNNEEFTPWQKLICPDRDRASNLWFGCDVEINDSLLLVGAFNVPHSNGIGVLYVYHLDDQNKWEHTKTIYPPDTTYLFASAVALDGKRILVGAYADHSGNPGDTTVTTAGAAYLYEHDGNNWEFSQKITAPERKNPMLFGKALDIKGNRIAIGAPVEDSKSGAVYVYNIDTDTVQFHSRLIGAGNPFYGPDDGFGESLALEDPDEILVGSPGGSLNLPKEKSGVVYRFNLFNDNYQLRAQYSRGTPNIGLGSSLIYHKDLILLGSIGSHSCWSWSDSVKSSGVVYEYTKDVNRTGCVLPSTRDVDARFGMDMSLNDSVLAVSTLETASAPATVVILTNKDVTHIRDITIDQLTIHPNPATDYIVLRNHNQSEPIQIFDSKGQQILHVKSEKQGESCTINVRSLQSGVYFIVVEGKTKCFVKM